MKRAAGILALVLVVSLLGTSDVRGFALAPAGKTTGASLTATIVIDVTDSTTGGLASIRVQKSTTSTAALFTAGTIKNTLDGCSLIPGFDLQGTVAARYTGLISTLIDTPEVLTSLFGQFGDPQKAAIVSQDYAACTTVTYPGPVVRQYLSFTAVIQFQAK